MPCRSELVGDERLSRFRLAGGEVTDHLRAFLGCAAQRIGERDRIV
jgi:hypothetical protein